MDSVPGVLQWLTSLPAFVIYLILGLGAATENVVPPVPADTFVLAGALLAARGAADPWTVFLVTWLPNVLSAVGVYVLARRYGRGFFKLPVARWLLREHQLEQIGSFYSRFGIPAIFLTRFLPGIRAMVPVFAGVSHVSAWKVVPPIVVASAVWYGLLVYLGAFAGRNLGAIISIFNDVSSALLLVALGLVAIVAGWWWRTRHPHGRGDRGDGAPPEDGPRP
ncbi:MAG TPA: DedA family protein [Longimicrobiales bacterium]|nr:DedA family protein [Longimicrobiales bacterium]